MNISLRIAASPRVVFDYLTDPDKLPLWMDGLESSIYPDGFDFDQPQGRAFQQRMTQAGRTVDYTVTITRYDPPRLVALRLESTLLAVSIEYALAELTAATRLVCSARVDRVALLLRAVRPLFEQIFESALRRQLNSLKELAETVE